MDSGQVRVTRWRRYGKDRLYVTAGDARLGWHDLLTGENHLERADQADALEEAVAAWTAGVRRHAPAPRQPLGVISQVRPAEARAERAVDLPKPPADDADTARSVTDARAGEDLADRRAGAMAREQAVALKQASPVRTFLARVLGAHTDERAWRIGADGEEKVAAQLAKLVGKDPRWHALHAIPVGGNGADIDHLVIGPGGVFTLNAKHHPRAKVWVGGNTFVVNGQRQPYLRNSQHEAARACRLLTSACGFPVLATGVVVPGRRRRAHHHLAGGRARRQPEEARRLAPRPPRGPRRGVHLSRLRDRTAGPVPGAGGAEALREPPRRASRVTAEDL